MWTKWLDNISNSSPVSHFWWSPGSCAKKLTNKNTQFLWIFYLNFCFWKGEKVHSGCLASRRVSTLVDWRAIIRYTNLCDRSNNKSVSVRLFRRVRLQRWIWISTVSVGLFFQGRQQISYRFLNSYFSKIKILTHDIWHFQRATTAEQSTGSRESMKKPMNLGRILRWFPFNRHGGLSSLFRHHHHL